MSNETNQPNQKPQTPPTPPQQPTTTKGSNMMLIIIIVVIAALVFLGVGGYFGWKYYLSKKIKTSATPVVTASPTKSPTTSPTLSPSAQTTGSPTATPTASGLKTGAMPVNGYVIADSNSRVISESELINMTPWQLKIARNEIYARHGRPFVHKDLQCYFAKQDWYHGNPNYTDTLLATIENKNVVMIQSYEQKINSPLQNLDSGC